MKDARKNRHAVFSPDALRERLQQQKTALGWVVAYSGGLDSHVLLHSLLQLNVKPLRAVHINHQLHPNAHAWSEHCKRICLALNVHVECITVTVDTTQGQSIEAAAREARYRALFENLADNEYLLTAHHKTDQAETLLLQLLRGAGPRGLSGIRQAMTTHTLKKKLLRPLLPFSRNALKTYALAHGLDWIEDPANTDLRFDRNYLRHQVMPVLQTRWPSAVDTLARSATLCAETDSLCNELAVLDLKNMNLQLQKGRLPIAGLRALNPPRQKNLLRYWLRLQELPLPSEKKMRHILNDLVNAAAHSTPHLHWSGVELKRYKGELYAQTIKENPDSTLPDKLSAVSLSWNLTAPLQLPDAAGGGQLIATPFLKEHNDNTVYTVRFRRGGERCRLKGRRHSHSLKKLMQDWHIAPWLRSKVPLLYHNDTLIAVIGYCYCEGFNLPLKITIKN